MEYEAESDAFCSPLQFQQLCKQVTDSLCEACKAGSPILSQVFQAHSAMTAAPYYLPKKYNKGKIRCSFSKIQQHVEHLKEGLTSMLENVVMADAAIACVFSLLEQDSLVTPTGRLRIEAEKQSPSVLTVSSNSMDVEMEGDQVVDKSMDEKEHLLNVSSASERAEPQIDNATAIRDVNYRPGLTPNSSKQSKKGGTKSVTQDEKMQFICEICNKSFNKPSDHFRHIQIHDPNRPRVPCRHCSKTFTRFDTMRQHMKSQHPSITDNPNNFEVPRVPCKHCNKTFSRYDTMYKHVKTNHPTITESPWPETILTEMRSPTSSALIGIDNDHQPSHLRTLEDFGAEQMQLQVTPPPTDSPSDSYQQERLVSVANSNQVLGEEETNGSWPASKKTRGNDSYSFKCVSCSEVFSLESSFKSHDCEGSHYDPVRLFKCDHCDNSYSSLNDLSSHVVEEHDFTCLLCQQTYTQRLCLDIHMVIHSGISSFQCQECDKGFKEMRDYITHTKEHPDYAPYKCEKCSEAFHYPSQVVTHLQTCFTSSQNDDQSTQASSASKQLTASRSKRKSTKVTHLSEILTTITRSIESQATAVTTTVSQENPPSKNDKENTSQLTWDIEHV